jgi:hypothetical protein
MNAKNTNNYPHSSEGILGHARRCRSLGNQGFKNLLTIVSIVLAFAGVAMAQFHDIAPLPPIHFRFDPIIPIRDPMPLDPLPTLSLPDPLKLPTIETPVLPPDVSGGSDYRGGTFPTPPPPPPPPPPPRRQFALRILVAPTNDYSRYLEDVLNAYSLNSDFSHLVALRIENASELPLAIEKMGVEKLEEALINKLVQQIEDRLGRKVDDIVAQLATQETSNDEATQEAIRHSEWVRRVEAEARYEAESQENQWVDSDDNTDSGDSDDDSSDSYENGSIRTLDFHFGTALQQLYDVHEYGWQSVLNE